MLYKGNVTEQGLLKFFAGLPSMEETGVMEK
jgi:hypothetical protein